MRYKFKGYEIVQWENGYHFSNISIYKILDDEKGTMQKLKSTAEIGSVSRETLEKMLHDYIKEHNLLEDK